MIRTLAATSLLALVATPSIAQTGTQPTNQPSGPNVHGNAHSAMPATPAIPAEPRSSGETTVPATPATPAQPMPQEAQPTAPSTTAEPREVTVQKLVDAEFPVYDANKNGNLEAAEFSNWVLALYDASGDANAPKDAAAKAKWTKDAFATADSDKNKIVTKTEMNIFLVG
jgi:cell wall-associated NlpC family hydrolase